MLKKYLQNHLYVTWTNVILALIAWVVSIIGVIFYQVQTAIMWSVVFPLMLGNLAICIVYYYISNKEQYSSKQKIWIGLELITQFVILCLSFSLSMFSFYGLLLITCNFIYIMYWTCLFEFRHNMEVIPNETI